MKRGSLTTLILLTTIVLFMVSTPVISCNTDFINSLQNQDYSWHMSADFNIFLSIIRESRGKSLEKTLEILEKHVKTLPIYKYESVAKSEYAAWQTDEYLGIIRLNIIFLSMLDGLGGGEAGYKKFLKMNSDSMVADALEDRMQYIFSRAGLDGFNATMFPEQVEDLEKNEKLPIYSRVFKKYLYYR